MPRPPDDVPDLLSRLDRRDRAALSRLLTLASRGDERLQQLAPITVAWRSPSIAVTGSAGAGKSSLLGGLTAHLLKQGLSAGILACDPQSPLTGGALLGDRCRIAGPAPTENLFVRSLSAQSGRQGLADHLDLMVSLLRRFAFDWIFIETVGAGQSDTAVHTLVDLVVLVLQPQTGDELQWEKAGLIEVADVVVVNKGDLPGADQTVADVRRQLNLPGRPAVPVVKTSVARNEGIEEFWEAILVSLDHWACF